MRRVFWKMIGLLVSCNAIRSSLSCRYLRSSRVIHFLVSSFQHPFKFLLPATRVLGVSEFGSEVSTGEEGFLSSSASRKMRPIFCGNFEYDARQSDLEKLFGRYGKVDRVDMKSGFAFIYMDDERDAEDAIRALDRSEFGRQGRRLRVEWTKQERGIRRPGGSRRSAAATLKPTKTLFVINFDPVRTRTRDLEKHFDPYGKVLNIRIRRNFAFIQFESQEDATKALDATNMSKLRDRVISVEYAVRDDDDRRNGYSPDRNRDRSPERRRRSPSPYRRERDSPDYGRGPSPYSKPEPRASPDYGRAESPAYERYRSRSPRRSPAARERSPPVRSPPARSPLARSPPVRSPPARERSRS